MSKLENERHEVYCLHRAKGFPPSKAGMAAGFASGSSTISELEKKPEIVARIDELIAELRERRDSARTAAVEAAKVIGKLTGVGKAWVIQKLAEVAQLAAQAEDFKASNDALKLIGEEFGMFKGGSAADPNAEQGQQPIDLDLYESVIGKEATQKIVESMPGEEMEIIISDDALALIEGQSPTAKRIAKDRMLSTGSEADVAMTEAAEIGDDDDSPDTNPAKSGHEPEDEPEQIQEPEPSIRPKPDISRTRKLAPSPAADDDEPIDDRPRRRSQIETHGTVRERRGRQ